MHRRRAVYKRALYSCVREKAGYEVTVAVDGQSGLTEAQTNKYDIILLDIMIPIITGIEVLKRLKDQTQSPNFSSKIIIITNLEQSEEARKSAEQQADGYIVKADVTPKELVEFIQEFQKQQN